MQLLESQPKELKELMQWFINENQLKSWGGPYFRFPIVESQWHKDLNWPATPSFSLFNSQQNMVGFIQILDRFNNNHLGRVAIKPTYRGQGVGKILISKVLEKIDPAKNTSLFVYENNIAAVKLYRSFNFIQSAPPGPQDMLDGCIYMVRDSK
ncbi:GNAT family N-acetyltransferase [Aliikangiella sp. IMCC44359]|uniref:GNAT family N-acetyltransferase n=1 Tax=Aliikangiella sp. IMCC44359 TaxID=3459125 RepID=UPI00403B1CE7